MLRRFTPASSKPEQVLSSRLLGLASIVISVLAASSKAALQAPRMILICAGSRSEGVPPPMKIEAAVRPANWFLHSSVSLPSAST
jgi:hypothetical protein